MKCLEAVLIRFLIVIVFCAQWVYPIQALATPLGSTSEGVSDESVRSPLVVHRWRHGASDCALNTEADAEVYVHDTRTYILRQNKCRTFEAPFIYILVGRDKILLVDTGDIEVPTGDSLFKQLQSIVGEEVLSSREILVIHTHSHGDHYRGDSQFADQPKVTLVQPVAEDVRSYFGFREWPSESARLDLGERKLIVIPTPGHQEEAITIFDPHTGWLLTGDTLYPGYIYVKHWDDYKKSIGRLAQFSKENPVSAIMGSHIEMSRDPGQFYAIGTRYQPNERALYLAPGHLDRLHARLAESNGSKALVFDEFIVKKMNLLQRTLSNIARSINP